MPDKFMTATTTPLTGATVPHRFWWHAVYRLNLAKVDAYLKDGVQPSRQHRTNGHTALGWLAQGMMPMHRHADASALVDRLVAAGADPLREEAHGKSSPLSPLMWALVRETPVRDVVQALIRGCVWTPERRNDAAGALMRAALLAPAATGAVEALLAHGLDANVSRLPDDLRVRGTTVKGEDPDAQPRTSALYDALQVGTSEDLGRLLDAGATLSPAEQAQGLDPYVQAVLTNVRPGEAKVDQNLRRRTHLIALLGRQVPMTSEGHEHLMPMVMRHPYLDPALLDRLHAQGARWDGTVRDGHTALHAAMMNPDPGPLVEHLLNQGLDLDARTGKGETPMDRLRSQVNQRAVLAPLLVRLERRVLSDALNGSGDDPGPSPLRSNRTRL